MSAIAISLLIMTAVIRKLGDLDPDILAQGLLSLGLVLAEIAAFSLIAGGKTGVGTGAGILLISAALLVLVSVVERLGQIKGLETGLSAMAGMLLIVTLAIAAVPKDAILRAAGIAMVAAAVVAMAFALTLLSKLSYDEIERSLIVLAGGLVILAGGLYLMSGTLLASASLVIAALALVVLAGALSLFSIIKWSALEKGLAALAGVLVILGIAGLLLTPVIPTLTALAGSILLIGIAVAAIGVGVALLSYGLASLAISAAGVVGSLAVITSAIVGVIKAIFIGLGNGVLGFVEFIGASIGIIVEVVKVVLLALLDLIVEVAPDLFTTVMVLIKTFLSAIAESLPDIIDSAYSIMLAFLQGIADNIQGIVEAAYDIVINFLAGITEKTPDLVDGGFKFILTYIESLTDAIDKYMPDLVVAMVALGKAALGGFAEGFKLAFPDFNSSLASVGDVVTNALGISNTPDLNFAGAGSGTYSSPNASTINGYDDLASRIGLDEDVIQQAADLNQAIQSSNNGSTSPNSQSDAPTSQKQEVTFIQNNNSPKALNRIDIYRQTANQLLEFQRR